MNQGLNVEGNFLNFGTFHVRKEADLDGFYSWKYMQLQSEINLLYGL